MSFYNYGLNLLMVISVAGSLFAQNTIIKADSGSVPVDTLKSVGSSSCKSQLTISSEPVGATVILDDSLNGKCPITFTGVDTGNHQVQLRMKGYYLKKASFRIDSCENKNLQFTLLQPGGIYIKSNPDSANVFIDEKSLGKSPCSYLKVKPGDYKLNLVKKNYKTVVRTLTIRSGVIDTLIVPLSLTKEYQDSVKSSTDRVKSKNRWANRIVFASFAVFSLVILLIESIGNKE
jgi:hypothetical protein